MSFQGGFLVLCVDVAELHPAGHLPVQPGAVGGRPGHFVWYLMWLPGWLQAIFQCIQGLPEGGLRRIILTASGGAFRDWPVEKLKEVRAADAIKHPNWRCALP